MYKLIVAIVNRGDAEVVIETANHAGARGGTIFSARGSGTRETTLLFNIAIEPEKEVVYILTEEEKVKGIVDAVSEELEIDKPGTGIIFVQPIDFVRGIVNKK